MSTLKHLPPTCTLTEVVEANDEDGGVVIEDWLSTELLAAFNAELEPWLDAHSGTNSGSEASDSFLGLKTRRIQGLAAKTPSFVDIVTDDLLFGFASETLRDISPSVILNNGELIDISPGESAQPLHRDDDAWNFVNQSNPLMINSITALVDITAEMGATLVIPGSHRWESARRPTRHEVVPVELKAGSSLFFRGDTLHAGGANNSRYQRRALSIGICCAWLRPVENSYTNIPLEKVRQMPERAQSLLGYELYDGSTVGGGYLGYHELGDPRSLLENN